MTRRAALFAALLLSGCAAQKPVLWERFDGQSIAGSAALQQQSATDLATCRAIALNAGNQVQSAETAPQTHIDLSTTTNVYIPSNGAPMAPPTSAYGPPSVDFSGFAAAGRNIAATRRRNETEEANFTACMAQRGYRQVP